MNEYKYIPLNSKLDVPQRLVQQRSWTNEFDKLDKNLDERIELAAQIIDKATNKDERLLAEGRQNHLEVLRRRLSLMQIREPFYMEPKNERETYEALYSHVSPQYANLSKSDRKLWLDNLIFLHLPPVKEVCEKLDSMRERKTAGQRPGLFITGESGSGKTSALDWYAIHNFPEILDEYTRLPVIKVEPLRDDTSPKTLSQQIILASGKNEIAGKVPELQNRAMSIMSSCKTELLIVEEVSFLARAEQREQLITFGNFNGRLSIAVSSPNPNEFEGSHPALQGRFKRTVVMEPYTGKKLHGLLGIIELLLPFPSPSYLSTSSLSLRSSSGTQTEVNGIAAYIEEVTKGNIREIMTLIDAASRVAIDRNYACLTLELLKETWEDL